jgi:haloacetate dehalogenase
LIRAPSRITASPSRIRCASTRPARTTAPGRTTDLAHDEADRAAGNKIGCPLLAIWGESGIPSETRSPLDTWREWAKDVRGFAIDSGHYLPEENPQATADALLGFFGKP